MNLLIVAGAAALLLTLLSGVAAYAATTDAYFDVSITPTPGDTLASADYRLWLPGNVETLRGVIVRQHGCGTGATSYGLAHAHDVQWQALARKHHLALVGTRLMPKGACPDWTDPDGGSAKALFSALADLAQQTGHSELAHAPLVLCGHSGGAFWTTGMALRFPTRIIAAVPARGRTIPQIGHAAGRVSAIDAALADDRITQPDAVAAVPILWANGANDEIIHGKTDPRDGYKRPLNALWTLAVDPVAGHELAGLRALAIPYLDAIIALRLPGKPGDPLRPLDPAKGWLGDPFTFGIAPASKFTGDKTKAAWLPSEALARRWKEYVSTGHVAAPAAAPPPAPTNVHAAKNADGSVTVTWSAEVSLDAPVPSFAIYRDSVRIGVLDAPTHGYGDEPTPVLWSMTFRDAMPAGESPPYQVTAVQNGRESPRSAPANVVPAPPASPDLPDLVVTGVSISPTNPKAGDSVTVVATITNQGKTATPNGVLISAAFRVNNQNLIGAESRQPLAPGAFVTLAARGVPGVAFHTGTPGTPPHTAFVVVDELGRIAENDKTNNTRSVPFTLEKETK